MPNVTLFLGNSQFLSDDCIGLHPCVDTGIFKSEKVLSFIPPDGSFNLANYVIDIPPLNQLPIIIRPQWHQSESGFRVDITVQCTVPSKVTVDNVVVSFLVPADASMDAKVNVGTRSLDQEKVSWTIGTLSSDTSTVGIPMLNATFTTSETLYSMEVLVDFTTSLSLGITVDNMVLHESYRPFQGGKHATCAGHYAIRM